jgi:hypothetical protein
MAEDRWEKVDIGDLKDGDLLRFHVPGHGYVYLNVEMPEQDDLVVRFVAGAGESVPLAVEYVPMLKMWEPGAEDAQEDAQA